MIIIIVLIIIITTARMRWTVVQQLTAVLTRPTSAMVYISTKNHDSQQQMRGYFLFYHQNDAINAEKSRNDETPSGNILAGNEIVLMKTAIETATQW